MLNNKATPQNTPLDKWPPAWLKIECASLLDTPGYIMMTDHEREHGGYPASDAERREFIAGRREADALLADPSKLDS